MNDLQENQAPVSAFASEAEEIGQVALPGAQLAAQRRARGWSVEHAASRLKFAPRQILALETDNYMALPELAVVRGFVRAYAKLLGLDANVLVALLPQEGAAHHAPVMSQRMLSMPFSESSLPLQNHSRLLPVSIAGGIAVAVLAGAAFVIDRAGWFNEAPQLAWLKSSAAGSVIAAVSERVADAVMPSSSPAKAAMPETGLADGQQRGASEPEINR
ncbi:MAG: helix-turn-helix domain-containing protein [Herbaspirillum sp.]